MTIWFTADTHFGHANIIKYCDRPFSDVDEMNEEMIQRWNQRVHDDDSVYHLGDFSFDNPIQYAERLAGRIYIIEGSHDRGLKRLSVLRHVEIIDTGIVNIAPLGIDTIITLCHYAMRSWPRSHYASWHLFGHHHGKLEPYGLSFDVGVDCWAFAPVSLDEVAAKMKTLKPIVDYRKKENNG